MGGVGDRRRVMKGHFGVRIKCNPIQRSGDFQFCTHCDTIVYSGLIC